jgi:putative ABC transport system substrate-binding protein
VIHRVGILKAIDHPALDKTADGVIEILNKEIPNVKIIYESAQADAGLAQQITQKFLHQGVDAIVTIGTTVTQVAIRQTKTIPIVFASVTDPVGSGIVTSLTTPNANVTGVSNFSPDITSKQFEFFKKLLPRMEKIGLIYNSGESNSVVLVEKAKEEANKLNITVKEGIAQNTNDAVFMAQSLSNTVDAIFIDNDNTALGAIKGIVDVAIKNWVPVFCSDTDTVELGVFAAVGPDQKKVGEKAGQIVVDIIKNKKPVNEIPVQYATDHSYVVNKKTAAFLEVAIPTDNSIEVIE